jgi:hypothetical protein
MNSGPSTFEFLLTTRFAGVMFAVMASVRFAIPRLLVTGLFLVLVTRTFVGQDFIRQNPAFEKVFNNLTPENRDQMLKYLLSLSPEKRKIFIDEMVKMDTDARRNRISVERVTAKWMPSTGNEATLTVTSFDPKMQPLSAEEIEQLKNMGVRGNLQVEGFSTISPEELLKWPKVRIILVMQRQIPTPVEFRIPQEGTLFLVQTYNGWQTGPAGYSESNKTVRIEPLPTDPLRTRIDYDIGNGRVGGQAFFWGPVP